VSAFGFLDRLSSPKLESCEPSKGYARERPACGFCGILQAHRESIVKSKNRTVWAVAATAGIAAVALLAVLRSDSMGINRRRARRPGFELERWDYEGGNIPEVSVDSGEQGSINWHDERSA
jgi:hypothetical protein